MPKFNIVVSRTLEYSGDFEISAKDEEAAQEKAEALLNDDEQLLKLKIDWQLEEETHEILEVNEE